MSEDIQTTIKRKWSPELQESKRRCVEQADVDSHINICDLSDCILIQILELLDATSLYQLGKTCTRFYNLVQDTSFWIDVDARREPNNDDKYSFCWKNINSRTKRLFLAGKRRSDFIISLEKLTADNLVNLTVLALEHQYIKYCKLNEFPSTLVELSFRHSFIPRHSQFFRQSDKTMCNLKTLILDHCQWLESECLSSFSKYPKLEILSLYMCRKLSEDDISIISIVGMMGFKSLKVADLRFTGLGDLFIRSFYKSQSLQSIYLQCSATTYYVDRYARKLSIKNGAKMNENAYISDDEENNDSSKKSVYNRYKAKNVVRYNTQVIKDETCSVFNRVTKNIGRKERPKSILYRYPYEQCRCGFLDKNKSSRDLNDDVKTKSNYTSTNKDNTSTVSNWDLEKLKAKYTEVFEKQKTNRARMRPQFIYYLLPDSDLICNKIIYDSCTLPSWCTVESTPDNILLKWLYIREPKNDFEISTLEHADKHIQVRMDRRCDGKGAECICLGYHKEYSNMIVITRGEDGTFAHTNRSTTSRGMNPSAPLNDTDRNYYEHEYTDDLINKFYNCMFSLQNKSCKTPEDLSIVQDFITFINDLLLKTNILELNTDIDFLRELYRLFFQMARYTMQDMRVVLNYHFTCFEDLLTHLEADDMPLKKNILIRFFSNLVINETRNCKENCNLPGPSGLQSLVPCKSKLYNKMADIRMLITHFLRDEDSLTSDSDSDDDDDDKILGPIVKRGSLAQSSRMESVFISYKLKEQIFTNIQELSFRGYYITDYTLNHLKKMELTLLDVTGTNVTPAGIRDFLIYNPECQVIHEEACTCRPNIHF